MRNLLTAAMTVALLSAAQAASAQEIRGFAFGGTTSESYGSFPSFGGGVLVDLGQPWLAVGAQAEAFASWPYFAGRGSVFAEGRLLPKSAIVPLVLGGAGFGAYAGPMVGGGVEIRVPRSRLAFRITVEDYMHRGSRYALSTPVGAETHHQVATRFGVSF